MDAIIFWPFALLALLGAVLLIFHKNPIHSALALIMTLFSTAALFVMLHAGFVAVLQILVYAGAIMVLFIFVIMMLNLQREELGLRRHAAKKIVATVLALGIGLKFALVLTAQLLPRAELAASFGSVENVGMMVFNDYMLPFQAIGVLLLSAVIGAVVVAKTRF